ncbi:MAG: hypothetical protein PHE55_00665 [Methylococcaceae bacterium]|nr:hypothetical protein [Methylococcaceae bacterium]
MWSIAASSIPAMPQNACSTALHYLDAELYIDNGKNFLQSLEEMGTSDLWLKPDMPGSNAGDEGS